MFTMKKHCRKQLVYLLLAVKLEETEREKTMCCRKKWVPPIVVTYQRQPFFTSMIVSERVYMFEMYFGIPESRK